MTDRQTHDYGIYRASMAPRGKAKQKLNPTTRQTHNYTTFKCLCSKNCHAPELSETNFYARLNHSEQLLAEKYPPSGVRIIFVYWRKRISRGNTEKKKYDRLYAYRLIKKKDVATKTPAGTINLYSLIASVGELQNWLTLRQPVTFVNHGVNVSEEH